MADDFEHDELTELRAIRARIGADGSEGFETLESFETPPEGIWDRIAAEVADDVATTAAAPIAPAPAPLEPEGATVHAMPRRVPPAVWAVGAAAAVVIAIVGLVAVLGGGNNDADLVASSVLERLQGETAEGTADLVDEDGTLRLQVDTSGLDDSDGFFEVWMIDPEVTQLVSLGPLRSDGIYDLPPGMDAAAFPIVDVSIEPLDGDPTHAGNSILRGQLQF